MQVYKLFFKILKKNSGLVFMYLVIFLGINAMISVNGKEEMSTVFQTAGLDIAVIDRDDSEISTELEAYLGGIHNLIDLEDDFETMQDELFFRTVEYILIIPQGYGRSIADGGGLTLENIKVPDSLTGTYIDAQVENYMRLFHLYLSAGSTTAEAAGCTAAQLEREVAVNMENAVRTEFDVKSVYYYFRFLPYIICSMVTFGLCPILLAIQKPDTHKRNICSPVSYRSQNIQMALGSVTFALGCWVVLMLLGAIMYPKDILEPAVLLCVLNSLVFTLVTVMISYLAGQLVKGRNAISALSNTISLGLSFLGGVFVPHSMMSSGILNAARFVPTYWYVIINDLMGRTEVFNASNRSQVLQALGIQLGFAAAIFCISLVVSKNKRRIV